MIEKIYKYPYSIYQKYFPNGNEEEFEKAFVSFDVSEEEFNYFQDDLNHNHKLVCLETVIFDLYYIMSEFDISKFPSNKFRE